MNYASMLVFYYYYNKLSKTSWLKTTLKSDMSLTWTKMKVFSGLRSFWKLYRTIHLSLHFQVSETACILWFIASSILKAINGQ